MDLHFFLRKFKYLKTSLRFSKKKYSYGRFFMVEKDSVISSVGFSAGDFVYIGPRTYIAPNVSLGNFCLISDQVNFIGHDHNFQLAGVPIVLSGRPTSEPFTIVEDDVWIGHGVTILRGVKIGEGAILAANSVITKDVKPYSIMVGIPAKAIKYRFDEYQQNIHTTFLQDYRNGLFELDHDRIFKIKRGL